MGQPWCHIGPPERLGPPGESPPQEISSLEGTGSGGEERLVSLLRPLSSGLLGLVSFVGSLSKS